MKNKEATLQIVQEYLASQGYGPGRVFENFRGIVTEWCGKQGAVILLLDHPFDGFDVFMPVALIDDGNTKADMAKIIAALIARMK